MALILDAVTQQSLMELADMVLGESQVGVGLEHQVHRLGISGHFLFIAGLEGLDRDRPREQVLDFGIGELRSLKTRRGADALDGRHLA